MILDVKNLCKKYEKFELNDINLNLEQGYIMGFIGANGAGKTTTLKSILNLVSPDSGTIKIEGLDMKGNEIEIKQRVGVMLGSFEYYLGTKLAKLVKVYSSFFANWNPDEFKDYVKKFNLDLDKKVRELSAGMRVKFGIALALSHNSKLIILDEPTSGLDPVAREELLDIFSEIVEDGKHSILFSTHITSDLDKCADYIAFIRKGRLVCCQTKDSLIDEHAIILGKLSNLTDDLTKRAICVKKNSYGFKGLIKRSNLKSTDCVEIEVPNLEDIMVYYNKEKQQ